MNCVENDDIRMIAKAKGVCLWEIAEQLGISDANFSRKLRRKLPDAERNAVLQIIKKLSDRRNEVST